MIKELIIRDFFSFKGEHKIELNPGVNILVGVNGSGKTSFLNAITLLYEGIAGGGLSNLFRQFNIEHPQDFTGHSLSVSDIIVLRQQGQVSSHYVDSWGYKELPQFLPENYLKNAEMAMEDDFGMIDGIINNGPKEIKAKEERPSVLEKLKGHPTANRQEPHEKTAPKKSAERER